MIPFCIDQGTGVICWSPLARGFLAGTRTGIKVGESQDQKRMIGLMELIT